jgi:hypothetical protein
VCTGTPKRHNTNFTYLLVSRRNAATLIMIRSSGPGGYSLQCAFFAFLLGTQILAATTTFVSGIKAQDNDIIHSYGSIEDATKTTLLPNNKRRLLRVGAGHTSVKEHNESNKRDATNNQHPEKYNSHSHHRYRRMLNNKLIVDPKTIELKPEELQYDVQSEPEIEEPLPPAHMFMTLSSYEALMGPLPDPEPMPLMAPYPLPDPTATVVSPPVETIPPPVVVSPPVVPPPMVVSPPAVVSPPVLVSPQTAVSGTSTPALINILTLGGSVTWGATLEDRFKAYPWMVGNALGGAHVDNMAMRATGADFPSLCIESLVEEAGSADRSYDLVSQAMSRSIVRYSIVIVRFA